MESQAYQSHRRRQSFADGDLLILAQALYLPFSHWRRVSRSSALVRQWDDSLGEDLRAGSYGAMKSVVYGRVCSTRSPFLY